MERAAKLTVLLGYNGTGKTTTLRNILEASGRRCLVVTPHDMEWGDLPDNPLEDKGDYLWCGINRHVWQDADPRSHQLGTLAKLKYLRDCVLVFDDCRYYFKASTPIELSRLFIARRQRRIDIFAVGHGFTQVPPVFFTYASDFILFETKDNIAKRKDVILNYDQMVAAQATVNKQAKTDPHYKLHIKV